MTVLGIDISKWNGNWNASKAKEAGASFAFIKASQATFTDPQFTSNWQKAKEAGLLRGAYHYLDYTKPGAEQANYFADLLKNDPGELPPVIDYEQQRTDNNPSIAVGFLRDCLNQLANRKELFEDAAIKKPMLYTGQYFWVEYGEQTNREFWLQFPLWVAHYTTSSAPLKPSPWPMWNFWQFTAKGPGEAFGSESLSIDINRFNGTLNELLEFAGVRIPIVNLNELYETIDQRITGIEERIAQLTGISGPPAGELGPKVEHLEQQVADMARSFNVSSTAMDQRLLAIEQKLTIKDPPVTPPSDDLYATCITTALNVRSGPGVSYPMVGGLRYGQRAKVLKRQNGWAQIENPSGWSSEGFLSFDAMDPVTPAIKSTPVDPAAANPPTVKSPAVTAPAVIPVAVEPPSSEIFGVCNTSGLNVRSGPGVTYPITGGLTYGQHVKILSYKNGWAQIDHPAGWSNERYLSSS